MTRQGSGGPCVNVEHWNIDAFSDRLNLAMGSKSAYSLGKETGIAQSLIRKYLSAQSAPGADKLFVLSRALGVSINWLLTGEGGSSDSEPGEAAPARPVGVEELGAHFEYARKAAVDDIASNQDAPSAIPMTLYARLAGPLADTVPDLEGQREAVLGRCIAMLRAVTDDEPVEMLQFSEEDLAQIVEVAMTGYRIACERRGVYPHV